MIKSVHLPWKPLPAPCQGEEAVTDRVCEELSFHRLFLLSALSQNDMQFIPGVFYKPFSLILRCKSLQAMAGLNVSQAFRTARRARQTRRQEDGEQCGRLYKDRVGGKATIWERKLERRGEGDSWVRECGPRKVDSERLGGRDTGRRAGG